MSSFEMYLIMQLDSLKGVAGFAAGVSALAVIVIIFVSAVVWEHEGGLAGNWVGSPQRRWVNTLAVVVIAGFGFRAFVPGTNQAAAIWLVPKLVNNEQLGRIAGNTLDRLEELSRESLRGIVDPKEKANDE